MSILIIGVSVGALLVTAGLYLKLFAGWRRIHQAILGGLTVFYGMWLALCTGTVLKLAVPGMGAAVLGTAAGAGVGFLTYLAVGIVGVVTGGAGVALGALGMVSIGAAVGGVGGAAGGVLTRVPVVHPAVWAPVVLVGVYLFLGALRRRKPISGAAEDSTAITRSDTNRKHD